MVLERFYGNGSRIVLDLFGCSVNTVLVIGMCEI